jgi:DNA-binding winged helix-turn-helix (wHTH) protein
VTDHGNWVQRPNDSQELLRLAERLELHDPQPAPPRVDRYGLLRFRGQVVTLSPREARVARALAASDGSIVPVSSLVTVAWGNGTVRTAAVHTCMARLRRRLETVGLTVRCVRGRGYLIDTVS